MSKFYISRNDLYMKLSGQQVIWTENKEAANNYDSKYAAKRHARDIGLTGYEVVR